MSWLASLFDEISDIFDWIGDEIFYVAWYFDYSLGWNYPANAFYTAAEFFWDLRLIFRDIRNEVDAWWDEISDIVYDLSNLYDYAHTYLRSLASNAYDYAMTAYAWAVYALEIAESALLEVPAWILERLDLAYLWASTAIQEIPAWITVTFEELQGDLSSLYSYAHTTVWNKAIEAWNYAANAWNYAEELASGVWADVVAFVNGIRAEIEAYIDGIEASIVAWATTMVDQAIAAFALDVSASLNVIMEWLEDIQSFFGDPLEFLWGKFTDWFLGPE